MSSIVLTPSGQPASPVEGEVYYDSTADKLKVRDSSAFREVVLKDSSGNVTINSGNVVIGTAGKGIDFTTGNPALINSATSSGQVLDVYEQGSWTITNTAGSGGTASLDNYTGYYTRIGNSVFCTGYIRVRSDSSTSTTFGGLPFSTANHEGARGSGAGGFNNEISTVLNVLPAINGTNFFFYSGSSIEDFSASKEIYFSLHYIAEL